MENTIKLENNIAEEEKLTNVSEVKRQRNQSSFVRGLLKKWVVYRLFTTLGWLGLIYKVNNINVFWEVKFNHYWFFAPIFITLIGFLLRNSWIRFFVHPIYFLIFPIIALYIVGKIVYLLFINIRKYIIGNVPTMASIVIFLMLAAIMGWIIAILPNKFNIQAFAALIAHVSIYLIFLQSFRWASNPFRPLLVVLDFLSHKGLKFIEETCIKPGLTESKKRETALTVCGNLDRIINFIYDPNNMLRRGFTAFTHGKVLPIIIYAFIFCYMCLAISFSFTLYKIEKAFGFIVSGLGKERDIFSYLYFSFLTQATVIPDGVEPLSVYGQIWICLLVFTGVLMLTFLLSLVTTSVGMHNENLLSETRNFFEQAKQNVERWCKELSEPTIETPVVSNILEENIKIDNNLKIESNLDIINNVENIKDSRSTDMLSNNKVRKKMATNSNKVSNRTKKLT